TTKHTNHTKKARRPSFHSCVLCISWFSIAASPDRPIERDFIRRRRAQSFAPVPCSASLARQHSRVKLERSRECRPYFCSPRWRPNRHPNYRPALLGKGLVGPRREQGKPSCFR